MPSKKRNPLAVAVGSRIAQLRKLRKWNQAELGKRCGVGQKRVSEMESGSKAMRVDGIERVAQALGVPPHVLFHFAPGEGQKQPDVDNRKMLGFLKNCDDDSRKFLWSLMESFVEFQTTRKS